MQRIKLSDGREFAARRVDGDRDGLRQTITIHFAPDIPRAGIEAAFDDSSPYYDAAALGRIEIYGEDGGLQGVQRGFTRWMETTLRAEGVSVKLRQDDDVDLAIGDLRRQADAQRAESSAAVEGIRAALTERADTQRAQSAALEKGVHLALAELGAVASGIADGVEDAFADAMDVRLALAELGTRVYETMDYYASLKRELDALAAQGAGTETAIETQAETQAGTEGEDG